MEFMVQRPVLKDDYQDTGPKCLLLIGFMLYEISLLLAGGVTIKDMMEHMHVSRFLTVGKNRYIKRLTRNEEFKFFFSK